MQNSFSSLIQSLQEDVKFYLIKVAYSGLKYQILLTILLFLVQTVIIQAAPGDLDQTFSFDGKTTTIFPGTGTDEAQGTALQADGKIIVVGTTRIGGIDNCSVRRFNPDGTLDLSFGEAGNAMTNNSDSSMFCNAVAIQSDGKIIAAGYASNNPIHGFLLVRFNNDGSFDTSFDGNGKVITPVLGREDRANAVAIQPDGKIVAAGYSSNGFSNFYFALVRYNSDGSLDTSFDGDGKVTTQV